MIKFSFDTSKYKFREMVADLFEVDNLEKIHEHDPDLVKDDYRKLNIHNENTTDFHDKFYKKLNNNWTELYEAYDKFIHDEVEPIFDEKFHYQYLPSFRVHLPKDNQAVHTWHFDSDPLHKHPLGEKNFFLPLTRCYGTNTMWVESEPWKLDFKPVELSYGEYIMFNGNQCHHGNKPNKTNLTRFSFDFRVIPLSKYNPNYELESESNSNKFVVGSYYKEL